MTWASQKWAKLKFFLSCLLSLVSKFVIWNDGLHLRHCMVMLKISPTSSRWFFFYRNFLWPVPLVDVSLKIVATSTVVLQLQLEFFLTVVGQSYCAYGSGTVNDDDYDNTCHSPKKKPFLFVATFSLCCIF